MGSGQVEATALAALGGVLLRGVQASDLEWMGNVPALKAGIAQLGNADELAAEHHRVMDREVFPYESVFRSDDALMGGLHREALVPWYARIGLPVPPEPDHLGSEIILYAAFIEAEEEGLDPSIRTRFAAAHLATWAPAALFAIRKQGGPLMPAVCDLALELLSDVLESSAVPEDLLEDPLASNKTGLGDLATALLRPSNSGWFLSRGDIQALSSASDHPCGFGARKQMLHNWLVTAVQHEQVDQAMDAVDGLLAEWNAHANLLNAGGLRSRLVLPKRISAALRAGAGAEEASA